MPKMDPQEKVQYVNDIFTLNGHLQFGPDQDWTANCTKKLNIPPKFPHWSYLCSSCMDSCKILIQISDSTLFSVSSRISYRWVWDDPITKNWMDRNKCLWHQWYHITIYWLSSVKLALKKNDPRSFFQIPVPPWFC